MNDAPLIDQLHGGLQSSLAGRHPSTKHVAQFFAFGHLRPGPVQDLAYEFSQMAEDVIDRVPDGPELTVALRKLLESKDAAVRAVVAQQAATTITANEENN